MKFHIPFGLLVLFMPGFANVRAEPAVDPEAVVQREVIRRQLLIKEATTGLKTISERFQAGELDKAETMCGEVLAKLPAGPRSWPFVRAAKNFQAHIAVRRIEAILDQSKKTAEDLRRARNLAKQAMMLELESEKWSMRIDSNRRPGGSSMNEKARRETIGRIKESGEWIDQGHLEVAEAVLLDVIHTTPESSPMKPYLEISRKFLATICMEKVERIGRQAKLSENDTEKARGLAARALKWDPGRATSNRFASQ